MERHHLGKISLLTAMVMLSSSCASLHETGSEYGTAIGCIGGAALGGGLTYLLTKDAGKAIAGGLVGGIAGCAAGNAWQKREQALAKIAEEEHIAIATRSLQAQAGSGKQNVGIVAQVADSGMFDTDSAQLSADGLRQVRKIAAVMKQDDQNGVVLIVGHTDATGNASWNQTLSENRAQSVGRVLQQAGLNPQRLYYQGAGSSRPVADNTTTSGRSANRRVEIVGLANETLLKQRVEQEGSNLAYLRYGTQSSATPTKPVSSSRRTASVATKAKPSGPSTDRTPVTASGKQESVQTASQPANGKNWIDFGGQPVSRSTASLAANLKPRSSGFSLIAEANASPVTGSCLADNARVAGEAKNLASGKALDSHKTREYYAGMNGRAWAGLVNNHLVTLSPVKVLTDNATVDANPKVYITQNYQSRGNRKADAPIAAVANAWEGEEDILYRVYLPASNEQPLSCIDLLVPKNATKAQQGQLFYSNHNSAYMAGYRPVRS
ncbi:OmpA family protein [Erwinia pyri]|uniref:OmpA family protein n=1 Tax=Erwinia pyri TaxID=3062598 RepID=A0AA50HR67_9GAMM|nr:OmpA family protein [Erwinia sp. DE2]WLS79508.1 OmpA family protein [Erwinia sp. DE2]